MKPHITKRGIWWNVWLGGVMISCWPTLSTAWDRYLEYNQ